MITPHRLLDLDYSLVNISHAILQCLLQRQEYSLDNLLRYCRADLKNTTKQDITLAVSFLFLVGIVKYNSANDLVQLTENYS